MTTAVHKILDGAVDLHCHSGPSPFPRRVNHVEAARDAERINMRAIVVKSHHHNTVMDLLAMADQLATTPTRVFGGIALNSQVGGINPAAVAMSLRMGGKIVWFPTFSSARHIACHDHAEQVGFPTAVADLPSTRVDIAADSVLLPETIEVLEIVKEQEAILTGGHMHPDDIEMLFDRARDMGITRMLVNHPDFIIELQKSEALRFVELGAKIEHECAFFDPEGNLKWDPKILVEWIETVGAENTVIASDLGQVGYPLPVDAFLRVATVLLDHGIPPSDVRTMFCDNPAALLGLDD